MAMELTQVTESIWHVEDDEDPVMALWRMENEARRRPAPDTVTP